MWVDWQVIVGVPHDVPVVGYGGETVNYLRLYSARASDEFDMQIFNAGDYVRAVDRKIAMETISKVLISHRTQPLQARNFASSRNISWWPARSAIPSASSVKTGRDGYGASA